MCVHVLGQSHAVLQVQSTSHLCIKYVDVVEILSCLEGKVDDLQREQHSQSTAIQGLQHGLDSQSTAIQDFRSRQDSQSTVIQDLQSVQDSLSQRMDRVETQSRGR